jgi:hypothetical protein
MILPSARTLFSTKTARSVNTTSVLFRGSKTVGTIASVTGVQRSPPLSLSGVTTSWTYSRKVFGDVLR